MFILVNPKTNEIEFALKFETILKAQEWRKSRGYDWTNLTIKMLSDWLRTRKGNRLTDLEKSRFACFE